MSLGPEDEGVLSFGLSQIRDTFGVRLPSFIRMAGYDLANNPNVPSIVALENEDGSPNINLPLYNEQIQELSGQDREQFYVNAGLLPDVQTRISQGLNRTLSRSEVENNLELSNLLDQRDSLLSRIDQLQSAGEENFSRALRTELESVENAIALQGQRDQERFSSPVSTTDTPPAPITSSGGVGSTVTTPYRSAPVTPSPYTYAPIDPLDDRYDFRLGEKVRNIVQFASSTGSSGNQRSQVEAARETTGSTTRPGDEIYSYDEFGDPITQAEAEAAVGLDAFGGAGEDLSLPTPNPDQYDPRGQDQLGPNSAAARRFRLNRAQGRLDEANAVAERTGYPGQITYDGIDDDIDSILNDGGNYVSRSDDDFFATIGGDDGLTDEEYDAIEIPPRRDSVAGRAIQDQPPDYTGPF